MTKAFALFLASTSHMDIATGVTQGKLFPNRHTTFLTVSDVPMQLSKPFQLAQQMNQNTSQAARKSPPNVEQYQYDFTLERNVLHGHWKFRDGLKLELLHYQCVDTEGKYYDYQTMIFTSKTSRVLSCHFCFIPCLPVKYLTPFVGRRYRAEQSKRNFIYPSNHVLFCFFI